MAGESAQAFVVHGAAHVRAVLGLGMAVTLLSAPGAAAYLGHRGFAAMLREGGWDGASPALLDCADAPGHAWAALAAGMPAVVLWRCPAWAAVAARFPGRVRDVAPPARDLAAWDARRGDAWLREWVLGAPALNAPGQTPRPASR